jgi:DNA invertase Pin-like site-specific DNA recombinase
MRTAVYLPVLSDARLNDTERRDVLAFVKARDWTLTETYGGADPLLGPGQRPGLLRMLRDGWRAQFEVIVVWDLSRLVRDSKELVGLLRQLAQMHVRLLAVKGDFDTDSGVGEASLKAAKILEELDREIRVQRVRWGQAEARKAGRRIGRPPRELDLDVLRQMRSRGQSIRQIARALGVAGSTVARRLKAVVPLAAATGRGCGVLPHD